METVGSLVDKLSIVNMKMWMQEDIKRNPDASDEQVAAATRKTNVLNQQRVELVDEIDEMVAAFISGQLKPRSYDNGKLKDYNGKR